MIAHLRGTLLAKHPNQAIVETHDHADHTFGVDEIAAAVNATILSPETLGKELLGYRIVDCPGHCPKHVALFDPESRTLIAGDAMSYAGLCEVGEFRQSLTSLASLQPSVVLTAHHEPINGDAFQWFVGYSERTAPLR
jgi:glyoxylase-like metal-dependent hydrolase (beta-lactamase superfamily II)